MKEFAEQIFLKRDGIMASTSSRPRGKLVTSREQRIILQAYNYFKKEEEAGEPKFKINAVLKKQVKLLGIYMKSYELSGKEN